MTKVEMVHQALEALGWSEPIANVQAYIKEKFNTEMSKEHISQTKSNLRKKLGKPRRRRRRGVGRGAADASAAPAAAKVSDILSFVETIRQWEEKIGTSNVREVVRNLLGR